MAKALRVGCNPINHAYARGHEKAPKGEKND